jgi:hypothetical protein
MGGLLRALGPPKAKAPLPGEGSGARIINSITRRRTPGNFTTSTDVKLVRLSAPASSASAAPNSPGAVRLAAVTIASASIPESRSGTVAAAAKAATSSILSNTSKA